MYQILGYYASINNQLYADVPAISDPNFSARGGANGTSHWIFTEPYNLCAIFGAAVTLTAMQLFDATYNAINIPQIYPVNLAVTPLTNPNVLDLRQSAMALPMNEEVAVQASAGAGGAEDVYSLIWIKPSSNGGDQGMVQPSLSNPRVFALVTAALVLTKGVWSPFATLSFPNPIKGGAYQVNGAYFVVPNAMAYKLNFVKSPLYQGRKMYPGNLTEHAYGNVPLRHGTMWMGSMGVFNNFELPQVSALGSTTTGSTTYTGYLDMTYKGNVGSDAMP